jgi:hypothetical protein
MDGKVIWSKRSMRLLKKTLPGGWFFVFQNMNAREQLISIS